MTTLTNEPLLPLTVYGTPSGNYNGSSPDFIGNAVIASSYYGHRGTGLQTVVLQVTNFVGVINLRATLNDWTEQAMWFDVDTYGNAATPTTATTACKGRIETAEPPGWLACRAVSAQNIRFADRLH